MLGNEHKVTTQKYVVITNKELRYEHGNMTNIDYTLLVLTIK